MSDEHLMTLQPGTIIAGRYEVVKCLGAGSMGLVYACRHRELAGHLVAVKVLFPEVALDKIAAARFRNEIFASYGVSHPNVVRAYEYIRDGDLVAYTMEHVGGGDLADRIGRPEHKFSIEISVRIISQMCAGVQAIHDAGIVHRDLKPENILLTKEGDVKIADFGIARTGEGPRLTEHGGVVGTIDYVSPEYMLNSHVDWRSDIYALGILSYEIITGESPFKGDSVYATMTKRLKTDPKPPSALRADCPKELDRIVLKAMARNPEERYQSAAEMFYDLQAVVPTGVSTAGAFLQVSKPASATYVGPTLPKIDETAVAHEGPSEEDLRDAGAAPEAEDKIQTRGVRGSSVRLGSLKTQSEGTVIARPITSQPGSPRGTQVISSDLARSSDAFEREEDTIFQPEKMEQMLSRSRGAAEKDQDGTPTAVSLGGGGVIDHDRMRRLSMYAEREKQSSFLDYVTIVAAVVIGLGVGFAIVKFFFPQLLSAWVG